MSLFSSNGVMECSSAELAQMRGAGDDFLLLDVRTGGEYAAAHIEPSLLMPLQELDKRMTELEAWRERSIVVMCHSGARSRSMSACSATVTPRR